MTEDYMKRCINLAKLHGYFHFAEAMEQLRTQWFPRSAKPEAVGTSPTPRMSA